MSDIPPEFQGNADLFQTAVELANTILAITETCTRHYGIEAGGAPIKSDKGPATLFAEFQKRGFTFNLLYSPNEKLSQFFSSDLFLILRQTDVPVVWGYVRKQRQALLATLASARGEAPPQSSGSAWHSDTADFIYGGGAGHGGGGSFDSF